MARNQGWTYRDIVRKADAGKSLLSYYTERYRHSDETTWRQRIEAGEILVEGAPASPEMTLRQGQHMAYLRPPWEEPDVPLDYTILYEDEHIMVVEKPSGMPVMPAGGFLQHTLMWQLAQRYPTGTPIPLHRLGRGTSGLLLLGRTKAARAHLSQQLRKSTAGHHTIQKTYRALLQPGELPDTFAVDQPIGRVPHPTLGTIFAASSEGRPALSEGHVLHRAQDRIWVEVTIATGRPHQIRIHMASLGVPLLGDPLYLPGGQPRLGTQEQGNPLPGDGGYHLHAHKLSFVHPDTLQIMQLCSPLPRPLQLP